MNIYETCPQVSNAQYLLRLTGPQDRDDLLKVYSDEKSVPLFNGDNCNGDDFYYTTAQRMQQALDFWIWSYENRWFVRMSILDRSSERVIGTMELCYRDADRFLHFETTFYLQGDLLERLRCCMEEKL